MKRYALLITLLLAGPAYADSRGGDLAAACNSSSGTTGDVLCDAYINGFVNGVLLDQIGSQQGTPICIPDGLATADIRRTLQQFAKAHPETLYTTSGPFMAAALMTTYPCKR